MLYAILGYDAPDSLERRLVARPRHLERMEVLQREGRVVLAGPFPAVDAKDPGAAGFTGSLMVLEFPSLDAASEWAANDAYVTEGVFERWEVRPFRQVLP